MSLRVFSVIVLFLVGAGSSLDTSARMYQWRSESTGTMQFSGSPPAWYRGNASGPRVWVFEEGLLVDDTAIDVPADQAERLRNQAFEELEARQRAEALRRLERAARRAELRAQARERAATLSDTDQPGPTAPNQGPAAVDQKPELLDDSMIDRLKTLIRDFDTQSEGAARPQQ